MNFLKSQQILWLAWQTYKSKPLNENESPKRTDTFLSGLLLQFVNPNVIIYGLATVSIFIVPYYKSTLVLIGFSLLLALLGFIATSFWALFGAIFQNFLTKNYKIVNITLAILLVYCALSLLI